MLKKLVAGAVLLQASLGVDCDSFDEEQKCQDPLKPCLNTISNLCFPENGPGCSGGSELIYCPANAVRDNIGRCGFKGCHQGSCVHDDPAIGSCYPAKNDSTCHPGTTKCVTPAPTYAPVETIQLKKCGIGLGFDYFGDSKLFIYDLSNGVRYSWSNFDFYDTAAFSSALDRSTDTIYTFLNDADPKRIIGYHLYTKQEILNKPFKKNVDFRGMDYNENDGHLYAASYVWCSISDTCTGDIYKLTTSGEFVEKYRKTVPKGTIGFLFSKNYTHVYYTTLDDKLYRAEFGSKNFESLSYTVSNKYLPNAIDWYTNDPNDPTMLICITDYTPECWTYNVETGETIKLFNVTRGKYYLHGMEVLYDEFENCQFALSTCPIKIDIKESSECSVIFKVLNSNCACIDDIEYIEILPSNTSPVKLIQPSWESDTGKYWAFDSGNTPFQGPFGIKIGKTGKELYEPNAFDLNDKMIYEIQTNLCD